jgi:hypothetical protein
VLILASNPHEELKYGPKCANPVDGPMIFNRGMAM